MSTANEIYVEAYLYYRECGYPAEDAHDIAAMAMERYLDQNPE